MSTNFKINYKPQPIESIEITRKGFKPVKLDITESGKVRVAVQKDGVQAYLFSKDKASELSEALALMVEQGEHVSSN